MLIVAVAAGVEAAVVLVALSGRHGRAVIGAVVRVRVGVGVRVIRLASTPQHPNPNPNPKFNPRTRPRLAL